MKKYIITALLVVAAVAAVAVLRTSNNSDAGNYKMHWIWWNDIGHHFEIKHTDAGVELLVDGKVEKTFSDVFPAVSYVKHTYGGTNNPRAWNEYSECQIWPQDRGGYFVFFNRVQDHYFEDSVSAAKYIDGSQWLQNAAGYYHPVYLIWKENGYLFKAYEMQEGNYLLSVNEQPTTLRFASFTAAVDYAQKNYH